MSIFLVQLLKSISIFLVQQYISCTAIAWQKKAFGKVENYERFQCVAHRLLQAPTVKITRMFQADIVVWL